MRVDFWKRSDGSIMFIFSAIEFYSESRLKCSSLDESSRMNILAAFPAGSIHNRIISFGISYVNKTPLRINRSVSACFFKLQFFLFPFLKKSNLLNFNIFGRLQFSHLRSRLKETQEKKICNLLLRNMGKNSDTCQDPDKVIFTSRGFLNVGCE